MIKGIGYCVGFAMLGLMGCSSLSPSTFVKNVTAADCSSPAAQQQFVSSLPQIAFLSNAQAQELMAQFCIGQFGTVSAPASAPGMSPAIK